MAQDPDPLTPGPATHSVPAGTTRTDDPDAIARDIRATRADIDETVDALGDRLDPNRLKDKALDSVADAAHGLVDQVRGAFSSDSPSSSSNGPSLLDRLPTQSVADAVKENPLPALAVGLSVAWFVSKLGESEQERYRRERYAVTGDPSYAPRTRTSYGYETASRYGTSRPEGAAFGASGRDGGSDGDSITDKASSLADQAKGKAGDLADSVKDAASGAADAVRHATSDTADWAQDRASGVQQAGRQYGRQSMSWIDGQMRQNPLLVGSVALAAGALVGLSLPETHLEHERLGEAADRVKTKALDTAATAAGRASERVSEAASEVVDEASNAAREVADRAKAGASEVADHAKDAAGDVASTAKEEADRSTGAGQSGTSTPPTGGGSSTPTGDATSAGGTASTFPSTSYPTTRPSSSNPSSS